MSGSTFTRNQYDAALQQKTALPAASATVRSLAIDLGSIPPPDSVDVELSVPATPALVDAKTITYTFMDSADNATFTAVPELSVVTSLGASGAGAPAVLRGARLPRTVRRYLAISATVLAAGGDSTAVSFTLSLKF